MILLVKNGGPSKIPAVLAVQRLDEVVVVDNDRDLQIPGVRHITVPVMTAEAVCDAAARLDGRPAACFTFVDPVAPVAAEVASRLSLPTLAPATAALLKDKVKMRDRLKESGIETPRYFAIESAEDLEIASRAIDFPCILKPATAAYGLGVRMIASREVLRNEFLAAEAEVTSGSFARFFPQTSSPLWLLEEYLDGPELSIEVLGHPSHPKVIAVHEKTVTEQGGHFREDRFATAPWKLTASEVERIKADAGDICGLLGFDRGVGNLEARLIAGGKLGVIELQTTPAGGRISAMTQRSHGVNLHELHALSHMQWEPLKFSSPNPIRSCVMGVIHADRKGPFRIVGTEQARESDGVFEVQILAEEGVVREPHSEYLGFVCAEGADQLSAQSHLEAALNKIKVTTS